MTPRIGTIQRGEGTSPLLLILAVSPIVAPGGLLGIPSETKHNSLTSYFVIQLDFTIGKANVKGDLV